MQAVVFTCQNLSLKWNISNEQELQTYKIDQANGNKFLIAREDAVGMCSADQFQHLDWK